jgi:circadian clock protein KaiC
MNDPQRSTVTELPRLASGIPGLDALTGGGLPKGETTLLCRTTGTGKSVLSMQFLAAAELRRVIRALEDLAVTAIITAERDSDYGAVSRYGVEEFVADNIIILRYVLNQERRRRTIEALKLRGARHGAREYPFAIDETNGVGIITLSDISLTHPSSEVRVSIGNPDLDVMCGGGAMQGSVTLISGTTGTGKSLLAIEFLTAGDEHQDAMLIAFEESEQQIIRNAQSWGHDLGALQASRRVTLHCRYGPSTTLERHLAQIINLLEQHPPTRLVIDGLSALKNVSTRHDFLDFLTSLTALVKARQITTLYTIAPPLFDFKSATEVEASTLIDAIILLRYIEIYGELHRGITVLKMRGSDHDKRIRELQIGSTGSRIGEAFRTTTGIIPGAPIQLLDTESKRVDALFTEHDKQGGAGDIPGPPQRP